MHDVVTDLDAGYGGSLADRAAEYGWFDQAHFTREFTDLVGVPRVRTREIQTQFRTGAVAVG